MSGPAQVSLGLPKPGPVLKAVLIAVAALGVLNAVLFNLAESEKVVTALAFIPDAFSREGASKFELWRFVTSGLLTHPTSLNHLLFSLVGLYFLSPELERRWGGARFARFLVTAVVLGNLFNLGVMKLAGPEARQAFHPALVFGPGAAIAAVAVAWAREFPTVQIRLFFFLPVSGKALLWITIGFAALGVIYPGAMPEGIAAPFGGIVTGLLLAGTPSAVRALYLKMRLAGIRRKKETLTRPEGPRTASTSRRGTSAPLRVVYGGLEEELKKRKPPKDKRYLN